MIISSTLHSVVTWLGYRFRWERVYHLVVCGIGVCVERNWFSPSHQTSSVGYQDTWVGETIILLVRRRRQGVRAGAGAHTLGGGGPGLWAQERITQLVCIEAAQSAHSSAQPVVIAAVLPGGRHWGGGGGGEGSVAHPGRGEDVLEEGIRVKIKVIGELREKGRVVWLVVVWAGAGGVEASEPKSVITVWSWGWTWTCHWLLAIVEVDVWIVGVGRVGPRRRVELIIESSSSTSSVLLILLVVTALLVLLLLYGALLDVVGELGGRHPVGFLAVGLELGAAELGLSKGGGRVDHRGVARLEGLARGRAGVAGGGGGGQRRGERPS